MPGLERSTDLLSDLLPNLLPNLLTDLLTDKESTDGATASR